MKKMITLICIVICSISIDTFSQEKSFLKALFYKLPIFSSKKTDRVTTSSFSYIAPENINKVEIRIASPTNQKKLFISESLGIKADVQKKLLITDSQLLSKFSEKIRFITSHAKILPPPFTAMPSTSLDFLVNKKDKLKNENNEIYFVGISLPHEGKNHIHIIVTNETPDIQPYIYWNGRITLEVSKEQIEQLWNVLGIDVKKAKVLGM
jgi:hypothetical protein